MLNIFHRRRKPRELIKESKNPAFGLTWERRELPQAGAQQYAFESLGLPRYWYGGDSAAIVQRPLRETTPASYQLQTAVLVGNPPSGVFQGQFVTQPLMDPNTSQALGITQQGSIPPGAYNVIPPSGPTLAP